MTLVSACGRNLERVGEVCRLSLEFVTPLVDKPHIVLINIKDRMMLRSACFAVGLFVGLWGLSFLAIDKLVMFQPEERDPGIRGMLTKQVVNKESRPIIDPPDWAAFTLLSIGSVTMLYAVALPKRG